MEEANKSTKSEESDKGKMFEEGFKEWFKDNVGEEWSTDKKCGKSSKNKKYYTGAGTGVYCLGFIGALVYYIGASTSFWIGVLGILKSIVWPAFVVHGILKFLGL
ncbi:hypothetical protein KKD37_03645 [Patescibacteria group bacterium]|nr:hypothetical protein [Patescibacteria group bacterium]